jgi:hypothetical protein
MNLKQTETSEPCDLNSFKERSDSDSDNSNSDGDEAVNRPKFVCERCGVPAYARLAH